MGLSSSCWLRLHMSNVWPHQKFVWLVTLEFLQMKAIKSCMAAVIFELSMLVSLIKEHTVQPIPTNMFLSFSLALAQPFFDSCLPCLLLATTGNGGHSGSLNLCRIYWLSCIMGICMKLVVQGLPHFYPVFLITLPFQGAAPLPGCIQSLPFMHQIAYAPGPDTSAQVGTTWPSFCAQRLATLNLRQCVSPSCQIS